MSILVINVGSSTVKFAVFDLRGRRLSDSTSSISISASGVGSVVHTSDILREINERLRDENLLSLIKYVGHRVVHGGQEFTETTQIDDQTLRRLGATKDLAPLHNPRAISMIHAVRDQIPYAETFAVFDTAFFANLPLQNRIYSIPQRWTQEYGIRRFGFHGISHESCSARARSIMGHIDDSNSKLVVCHLGNGCSASAILGSKPLSTSMGFTPNDGLMMGTRCGSIDPGIISYLMSQSEMSAHDISSGLNEKSGLLGVSGASSDYRFVEQSAAAGNSDASLAIQMFQSQVLSTIGSMFVTLGGTDALVFTGGIGEHSSNLRQSVCESLSCLGIAIDAERNLAAVPDTEISGQNSKCSVFVLASSEEPWIAREIIEKLKTI